MTKNRIYETKIKYELLFPPVSDKFLEGYAEDYSWTAKYIRFRKLHPAKSESQISEKLRELGQPAGRFANSFRGALIGLAVGDALGATNEFKLPNTFPPIREIVGGGPFNLEKGQWTDDTSMAYALGQSLIFRKGFDIRDQMDKYLAWWKFGAYSSNGKCFDIGNTVRAALEKYNLTDDPMAGSSDPMTAGNGSLMRLAPVVLFFFSDIRKAIDFAGQSSKPTHSAIEAVNCCQFFAALIHGAIHGRSKLELLKNYEPYKGAWDNFRLADSLTAIISGEYLSTEKELLSTTGYVIDTLKASLWCFAHTDTFADGAIAAANLGGDTDTIAAVYGQIAGAYYGESKIPAQWIQCLSYQHIFYKQAHEMLISNNLA